MTNRHRRFLKVAREMALKSDGMRRAFGAVIVDGNKILATGRNRKSHPKIPTNVIAYNQEGLMKYYALHAEVDALLKCDFDVRGASIYIHGQNRKSTNLVHSGPCKLCQQILKERGIKEAIYPTKLGTCEVLNLS